MSGTCWDWEAHPAHRRGAWLLTEGPGLLQEDMSRQEGEEPSGGLPFFHWICQPYFRPG